MLLNTKTKHVFTFDHYEYTEGSSEQEGVSFEYKATHSGTFVSGRTQTYMFTQVQIPVGDQVMNAVDKKGTRFFTFRGEQYPMYVNESGPIFDIFGNVTGYRHMLRRLEPISAGEVGHSG